MAPLTTWRSPNGQPFQIRSDAVDVVEPFFNRLNQIYPQYGSLGGYAHRPKRTLDGRMLGGLSTHATGMTLDVKAPDPVLRQMAKEFPHLTWGGKFDHYDPVHFEFGPTAEKHGALPPLSTKPFVGQAGVEAASPAPIPRETSSLPTGAAAMAAPVPYSNMPSPEQIASSRKMGQLLLMQGTSTEPVGHWTQALARVLQGGVGRAHMNEAENQQGEVNTGLASLLAGNPTPQQLVANPHTRDVGQSLWLAQAKSKIQGPEEFGKSGAIFQAPDGNFYSMQFGSRGERIVKPVEANGKPLVPAKGVTQVGDEMVRNADGSTVRNVGPQIANREAQEKIGTERGKVTAAAPKMLGAQADLERQHTVVNNDIDRAMKEIDWKSTGIVGGLLQAVPGTPAYALAQKIATIKANIGFDKLAEMRANSPTGSALGSVTERELAFLQSVFGSLEQAQSAEDIKYNLRRLKDYLKDSSSARRKVLDLELRNAGVNGEGLTGTVGVTRVPAEQPAAPAAPGGFSIRRLD